MTYRNLTRVEATWGYWRELPDWERRTMTVCIAAICNSPADKIVACTDWLVSEPLGSAETMLKQRQLIPGWTCHAVHFPGEAPP